MIRLASIFVLLFGCSAATPPPGGAPVSDAPAGPDASASVASDTNGVLPSIDAMQEQMLCFGECPPYKFSATPPPDTELVLQRSRPAYQVLIRTDGTVVYEGYGFVKVRGQVVDHIDPADAKKLVRRFENSAFAFDADGLSMSACGRWITDLSATTLTLLRGRRRLKIVQYECDSSPFELADEVDRVTNSARWTQCGSETRAPCEE